MHIQQDDSFNTYISFIHHLHSYFFSISSSLSMKKWACSYDAFVWAFTMVKTRSVTEQHLIIPFLDFRNYISTDSVLILRNDWYLAIFCYNNSIWETIYHWWREKCFTSNSNKSSKTITSSIYGLWRIWFSLLFINLWFCIN